MLLTSTSIEGFTHIMQGVLLIAFALLLWHYFKVYSRLYLRYSALASAVYGTSELLRLLSDMLATERLFNDILEPLALATQYAAVAFLAVAVIDIITGKLPSQSVRRGFYAVAGLATALSIVAFSLTPELPTWETTIAIASRYTVIGIPLLVLGLLMLRSAPAALGPRLIAATFILIGAKNLFYTSLMLAPQPLINIDFLITIKGVTNLMLLFVAAVGVIIWLLESERSNTIMALQRAEYLNTHDALTGVENRDQLVTKIPVFVDYCRASSRHLTLMMVGINRFSAINDTIGIRGGDRVLIELARRLESFQPRPLTVTRVNGDVFVIAYDHLKRRSYIVDLAAELRTAIQKPMRIDGKDIDITCAIGITRYPQHGSGAAQLMNKATIALANAKKANSDSVIFYERGMDEPYTRLVDMEPELKRALRDDEFLLYLQPFKHLHTDKLTGFEALIRWQHPSRGLIGPNEFLPFIEQLGLASELDDWVLEHAARLISRWQHKFDWVPPIAVNLSAKHFQQPELTSKLKTLLSKHQLSAGQIELEITENVAMSDMKTGMNVLSELQALGFRVAIDDFGTGYSSLAYLRRLPINKIKIDRSFIAELSSSDADVTIVRALIRLAHGLGKEITAEGVESLHQQELLTELSCDLMQGYFYAPPMAESLATEMLAEAQQAGAKRSSARIAD